MQRWFRRHRIPAVIMSRAHRFLAVTILVTCLLLAIASVVMWVRSRWAADTVVWQRWRIEAGEYHGSTWSLISGRGVIGLSTYSIRLGQVPAAGARDTRSRLRHVVASTQQFELPENSDWERRGLAGRRID
jgi:hypothetical protein